MYDEEQVKALLKKVNDVEKKYKINIVIILIIIGLILLALFPLYGGTDFKDFVSGLLLGGALSLIVPGIIFIILINRKK